LACYEKGKNCLAFLKKIRPAKKEKFASTVCAAKYFFEDQHVFLNAETSSPHTAFCLKKNMSYPVLLNVKCKHCWGEFQQLVYKQTSKE
jgi:hypothetical protein